MQEVNHLPIGYLSQLSYSKVFLMSCYFPVVGGLQVANIAPGKQSVYLLKIKQLLP